MRDRASLLALGISILAHVLLLFGLPISPAWKGNHQVSMMYVELKTNVAELLSVTPNMLPPVAQPATVMAADDKTGSEERKVGQSLQPVAKPIGDLVHPVSELEKITDSQALTPENLEDYCRNRSQKEADRYANQPDIPGKGVVHDPCVQG